MDRLTRMAIPFQVANNMDHRIEQAIKYKMVCRRGLDVRTPAVDANEQGRVWHSCRDNQSLTGMNGYQCPEPRIACTNTSELTVLRLPIVLLTGSMIAEAVHAAQA